MGTFKNGIIGGLATPLDSIVGSSRDGADLLTDCVCNKNWFRLSQAIYFAT